MRAIPDSVGYTIGKARVNAIAFADVVLVAETPTVLRRACEAFTKRLSVAGLRLNPAKSATFTLVPSGRVGKVKIVGELYSLGGTTLPALGISDLWSYLGLEFAGGKLSGFKSASYAEFLGRISAAPMKPQMKLTAAKTSLSRNSFTS
jgi:hypothetical protein